MLSAHIEPGGRQPRKGDKVVGRVLELQPATGRVKLTLRKALVSSKLAVLSSAQVRSAACSTGSQQASCCAASSSDALSARVGPDLRAVLCYGLSAAQASTVKPAMRLQEAEQGSRAHGVVTGVHEYGIFVAFYNDCSGLAPLNELPLAAGQKPADAYSPGQVHHRYSHLISSWLQQRA